VLLETILKTVKDSNHLFMKLEEIYTSDKRKVHLKCVFLELQDSFAENKLGLLNEFLNREDSINLSFTSESLDDKTIRIRCYRSIQFGIKVDSSIIFYMISNKIGVIFFSSELDKSKIPQKYLLGMLYPLWRRIVIDDDILNKLQFLSRSLDRKFDGFIEKRKIWEYVGLKIAFGSSILAIRVFNNGTIGFLSGSIYSFLNLFSKAIYETEKEKDKNYSFSPLEYSAFGLPSGTPLKMKYQEKFSTDEMDEILNNISTDPEKRFFSTIIHTGNPFLQLNVVDPSTGSFFLLAVIKDTIQISSPEKYDLSSLKALTGLLYQVVGAPTHVSV